MPSAFPGQPLEPGAASAKIAAMQRVLEPEAMDTPEEAHGYQQMDHSAANRSVVERFLQLGGAACTRVIDLGTGPGDIPILLAQQAAKPRIVAVDLAEEMLKLARPKLAPLGLQHRIEFVRADVKALPYPDHSFDGVFSNTILHHIPDPLPFLRETARILRPGGVLLIRDLFRPATPEAAHALVQLHAAGADPYQQKLFFDSFCAALTLDEARACADAAGLAHARVHMTSGRHYSIELPADPA